MITSNMKQHATNFKYDNSMYNREGEQPHDY